MLLLVPLTRVIVVMFRQYHDADGVAPLHGVHLSLCLRLLLLGISLAVSPSINKDDTMVSDQPPAITGNSVTVLLYYSGILPHRIAVRQLQATFFAPILTTTIGWYY